MFRELKALIKVRPLTLTVVALEGDKIRVCVIPQGLEADKKINDKVGYHKEVAKIPESAIAALTTPLCLEGTGEELDAEMPDKLLKFTEAHGELSGTLARAQQEIASAVTAIEERNKAKSKTKQTGKDDNKEASKKESKAEKPSDTNQSASLPLEWLAPSSTGSTQNGAANSPASSEKEVAAP